MFLIKFSGKEFTTTLNYDIKYLKIIKRSPITTFIIMKIRGFKFDLVF